MASLFEGTAPHQGDGGIADHFRLIREVGRGGQGIVFLAEDARDGSRVAIKILKDIGGFSHEALERLRREVDAAKRLKHPGICAVLEASLDGTTPYITMPYVEGRSLAQSILVAQQARDETWIARPDAPDQAHPPPRAAENERMPSGPSTPGDIARVLEVIERAARALHTAHEAGVIHRDVKPSNIMVTDDGQPVVLDFGLAQLEESTLPGLTRPGEIWGTPAYLAPEQLVPNGRANRRTDVWALGVTLYECLTLRRPFDGATTNQIFHAIQSKDPVNPCSLNRALPGDLKVVVDTALEKDRDRRYETALAFADDLKAVREHRAIAARPAGPLTQVSRWARRSPAVAASLLLAFLILVVGLVVTIRLLIGRNVALRDLARALRKEKLTSDEMKAARERSEGLRLLAESSTALPRDPGLALLLAIEGAPLAQDVALTNGAANEALSELREIRTFVGHAAPINDAEFSPDGTLVVTATEDGMVRVWSVRTGEVIASFRHPRVFRAAFTPKGSGVVTWATDGSCRFSDAQAWKSLSLAGAGASLLSPDAGLLLTLQNGTASIWSTETQKLVVTLAGHLPDQVRFAFSQDGARVFTVTADGTASAWAAATGARIAAAAAAFPDVRLLASSPDGRRVVGLSNGAGRVWDVEAGSVVALEEAAARPFSVAVNADGRRVVALTRDRVHLWDAESGERIPLPCDPSPGEEVPREQNAPDAAFSRNGELLIAASCDGSAHVWSARNGVDLGPLAGTSGDARSVGVSPDGVIVLTRSSSGAMALWNLQKRTEVAVLRGHSGEITEAAFNADGTLVVTTGRDLTARVWNVRRSVGAPLFEGHQGPVSDVRFSPDSKLILTSSSDGEPRVWNTTTYEEMAPLTGARAAAAPEFSPDGTRILALSADGAALLFESLTGLLLASLRGEGSFCKAEFSSDAARVVAASSDGTAHIFDARDGHEIARLRSSEAALIFAEFCAGGRRVVTASDDLTVRIWDVASEREIAQVPGSATVTPIVSPDGDRIVIASPSDDAAIYDAATGARIAALPGKRRGGATFSPDGRRVATEGFDGVFHVWDAASGTEITPIECEPGSTNAHFSPDGARLLTVLRNAVHFWEADTGKHITEVKIAAGSAVRDVSFSHDGRWIVISSDDETQILDGATTAVTWLMTQRHGATKTVGFSPDSQWLLAGYAGGLARLWPSDPLGTGKSLAPRALTLAEIETHRIGDETQRKIVRRMFEDTFTNDELIANLKRRSDLGETLRQSAITAARTRNPASVADRLRTRAWAVVTRAESSPEQQLMALRWIEAALVLNPQVTDGLTTLGAARYRTGVLNDSLKTLEEAVLTTPEGPRSFARARNSIFIAMVHARLGEHEKARSALADARKVLLAPGLRPSEEVRRLLDEAATLVEESSRR